MGRPKTLTDPIIGYILENHEEMKISDMAKRLNVKAGTIRCFLAKNGLSPNRQNSYFEEDVPNGYFNVNERVDWLTGLQP